MTNEEHAKFALRKRFWDRVWAMANAVFAMGCISCAAIRAAAPGDASGNVLAALYLGVAIGALANLWQRLAVIVLRSRLDVYKERYEGKP